MYCKISVSSPDSVVQSKNIGLPNFSACTSQLYMWNVLSGSIEAEGF